MRARLFVVFLVPMVSVLLALGGAYGWSTSRSLQQEFSNQLLGDLSYFVTNARHALRADQPGIVERRMERYGELYGARIAVLDRSGEVWASDGGRPLALDEEAEARIGVALSGRRSETLQPVAPWSNRSAVVVEPVFDDGNVIGAVLIAVGADASRGETVTHWVLLVGVSAAVIVLLVFVVLRLSNWVLQPMQRVDRAMAAIEQGQMAARVSDDTGPPEMRRMIRLFNQMAEEIERVVSRQQEFAMNASHELRNPLGALLMRVEYLATGLEEGWDEDVEKTREEGRRMSRILDTLLHTARAAQKDSPFAPVDLAGLVRDRLDAWRQVAAERGVFFALRCAPQVVSLTDRTAVESALDAVLDNALKFAPRGTTIEVGVVADSAGQCEISVRDHGPGLAEEELARVTDRFWRSPRDQNVPGSGLGLAIATDLLDALGGRVRVTAADGGGLRVALLLPAGGV